MKQFHTMTIAGLERNLPLCKVNDDLSIAGFVMFSDVEITVAAATELLKKCPEFDVLLCPEAKGIPLCYEMARQCGKRYYVARKQIKVYMTNPVAVTLRSITTLTVQHLYLDASELEEMAGKRVLIVDDVVSTGETLAAIEKLLSEKGAVPVGKAAVLAEGKAASRPDLIFLEPLPLFFTKP